MNLDAIQPGWDLLRHRASKAVRVIHPGWELLAVEKVSPTFVHVILQQNDRIQPRQEKFVFPYSYLALSDVEVVKAFARDQALEKRTSIRAEIFTIQGELNVYKLKVKMLEATLGEKLRVLGE